MAREYTITGDNITIANSNPVTAVFINPAAAPSCSIAIRRCWISQRANATSAQQGVGMCRQPTSFPTLTSKTPVAVKQYDSASQITGNTTGAAGTCGINASAEGAGSKTYFYNDNFNVLNGWLWVASSLEEEIVLQAGGASGFGLIFTSTAGTLTGWSFGVLYREMP